MSSGPGSAISSKLLEVNLLVAGSTFGELAFGELAYARITQTRRLFVGRTPPLRSEAGGDVEKEVMVDSRASRGVHVPDGGLCNASGENC